MDTLYQGSMFQIPFLHLKVRDWTRKKQYLMDSVFKNKVFALDNPSYAHTDFHSQNGQKIHNIKSADVEMMFKDELDSLFKFVGTNKGEVTNSWFEFAEVNQFHNVHNHGPTGYSCVCFVEYNKEHHTPTNFICPYNDVMTGDIIHFSPKNIDEGSIIFFPSLIPHFTDPNVSGIPRIIFSFNIRW